MDSREDITTIKTYIDDGSGKLYDKHEPDIEPEINLKDNPALQKLLWDIWRVDKTPIYGYSRMPVDADINGDLPEEGMDRRWATPAEIVRLKFRAAGLDIWGYNREHKKE